jgi:hypothetical protein
VQEGETLVEVWRAWGEAEANLVQGLLETNGIRSAIRGESTRLTHGFTLDGLAEVKILVAPADAARASELISQSEGMTSCPRCARPAFETDRSCRFCGEELSGEPKGR